MNENEKDFLIISFNEEAADYTKAKMDDLITKIEETKPKIIFVCTQESRSGDDKHFQHVFGEKLIKYIRLLKVDGSKTHGFLAGIVSNGNRNCRTRIYYLRDQVINGSNNRTKTTNQVVNRSNKKTNQLIIITEKEIQLTKTSSLVNIRATFKNAILTKVILNLKGIEYKFAVVNTHLFFTDKDNTFLKERTEQFFHLVNEFKLTNLYNNEFNIFFCGDLNFRLVKKASSFLNIKQSNGTLQKKILDSRKNGVIRFNNQNINNELYSILNKSKNSHLDIVLLKKFKESLDIIGFPLTCPLKQNRSGNIVFGCYTNQNTGSFLCSKTKLKGISRKKITTQRTPSNCDKILFALNNLTIKQKYLFLPKYPVKSDHRLVSLFGKFGRNQIEL